MPICQNGKSKTFFYKFYSGRLVGQTGSEARSKGFASWDHFVSMLFYQLLGKVSEGAPKKKFRFKSKLCQNPDLDSSGMVSNNTVREDHLGPSF
ncbi:MAG: hypothetical protein EA353_08900 [Puniceicoccaceae bacterium]|nr:MAG: hypothetical protein EA353_08900 [Puniceicoccaceae bacterium]